MEDSTSPIQLNTSISLICEPTDGYNGGDDDDEFVTKLNDLYMVYDDDEDDDIALYLMKIESFAMLSLRDQMEEQQQQQQQREEMTVLCTNDDSGSSSSGSGYRSSYNCRSGNDDDDDDEVKQRIMLRDQSVEIESLSHLIKRRQSRDSESDTSTSDFNLFHRNRSSQSFVSDTEEVTSAEIDESIREFDLTEYDSDSSTATDSEYHIVEESNTEDSTCSSRRNSVWSECESMEGEVEEDEGEDCKFSSSFLTTISTSSTTTTTTTTTTSTLTVDTSLSDLKLEDVNSTDGASSSDSSPQKREKKRSWTVLKQHVLKNHGFDVLTGGSSGKDGKSPNSPSQVAHKGASLVRKFSQRLVVKRDNDHSIAAPAVMISKEVPSNVPEDIRIWQRNRHAVSSPNREDKLRKILGDAPNIEISRQTSGNGNNSPQRDFKLKKLFGTEISEQDLVKQRAMQLRPHSYYMTTLEADTMRDLFTKEYLSEFNGFRMPLSDETMLLEDSAGSERKLIRSASLDKLIEWLTNHQHSDTEFMNVFLLMHRSFTTPDVLFDKLILRYNTPPPLNPLLLQPWDTLSRKQRELIQIEFHQFLSSFLAPVRIRVVNVVCTWVDRFYYDFRDDPRLRRRLMTFIDMTMRTHMDKPAAKISSIMLRRSKRRDTFTQQQIQELLKYSELNKITSKSANRLNSKFGSSMLSIRSRDIANQLTIICFGMFEKIQPKEFFGQAWAARNRRQCSPNVVCMIQRSNTVGSWVVNEILTQQDIRDRVLMVKKMVKTAEKLYKLRNYNTLVEVLSGLNSNPIYRLKLTWAAFERLQPELMTKFRELAAFISGKKNFAAMRSALKSEPPPAIPYLGMYLTDLTFIEDGNSDLTASGHINWTKRRWLADIIREIQMFQHTRYSRLVDIPLLRAKLMNINSPDLDTLYDLSLVVEPRK